MNWKKKRVLLTGSTGTLGKELLALLREKGASMMYPSRQEWNLETFPCGLAMPYPPDIIIHCAAYTDVAKAEKERKECVQTNIYGTETVAILAKKYGSKMVYISSDYVNTHPMGFYAFTKKAGEAFVPQKGLIIRTSFKPRGMWGENKLKGVFHPVKTNADWVDVIAPKILEVVEKEKTGVVNIGTKSKFLKDLAISEYPEVEDIPVHKADELLGYIYPRDTTMELTI